MSLFERDINTKDSSMWDFRIVHARKNNTPFPRMEDRSPYGSLHVKGVRFTGTGEDTVMREVFVYKTDDEGNAVEETEQQVEEPDFLVGKEITDAGIRVGSSVLIWQETYIPDQKSA